MTESLNVTPKTTLRSGKSEASVTIIKDSARVIILLRLTTDGHKASRGLYATAELLVLQLALDPYISVIIITCHHHHQVACRAQSVAVFTTAWRTLPRCVEVDVAPLPTR